MAPKPELNQGWGVPANTKKAHYFINGRSLCSRWMFLGWVEDNRHDHPDNCKACIKSRVAIAKAKGGAA